ncbi:MAG: hypothetical protein NVV73_00715 [Cellvibrionaceae bacterium]|nr:hypothetical protein [Cellvibrionaceae bacterium]
MLSDSDIEKAVKGALEDIVPAGNDRTWLVEYLYKHKIGNRLPRGKKFNFYRGIENRSRWSKTVKEHMYVVANKTYHNRISPFLLSQLTMLDFGCIKDDCKLNTGVVLDVISKLEGESQYAPSTDLVKHDIKFKRKGLFANYKHTHVPMLPNAYLAMLSQENAVKSIVENVDRSSLVVNLDKVESGIKSKGKAKGGRMTGHWLITREDTGVTIYIGVFPHARCNGLDEGWIFEQLQESERLLRQQT